MTGPGRARDPAHDRDTCRRLALDHVLGLIAGADWSDQLVLRGSMLMTAYAGSGACKPAALDFGVVENGCPVDEPGRCPYIDEPATVQRRPQVAGGAGRAELWIGEEFGTGGARAQLGEPAGGCLCVTAA